MAGFAGGLQVSTLMVAETMFRHLIMKLLYFHNRVVANDEYVENLDKSFE